MKWALGLSLLTALLWGLAPIFCKQFYRHCSSYMIYLIDACFGSLLILLPFALLGQPDYAHLGSAILLTAPYSFSYLLFLMAFEVGKVSLVSAVAQTYPIFTLVLAISLSTESLSYLQVVLVFIIVLSSMLIGLLTQQSKEKQTGGYAWFFLSLLAAFFLGVGNYFVDESVASYNLHTTTLAIFITQLILSAALMLLLRNQMLAELKILLVQPGLIKAALWASLAMSVGAISLYTAFDYGAASLVSTVSSLEPVFAIVFATVWLHERLGKWQCALIAMIFGALFFLSFG